MTVLQAVLNGEKRTISKRIPSPLKWHGGKSYLANKIVAMMPPHIHYVEPYAGGLSVLLAKEPEGVSEVVNDKHGELTNFWNVVAHQLQHARFERVMQATPFSENEYDQAVKSSAELEKLFDDRIPGGVDCVQRAVRFFIYCRQSLAGRMDGFASISRNRTRGGMNEQASAWLSAVEGLPAVHARLKRVVILNRDALDVIRQQDGPQTLYYLDPPYLHETRATTGEYEHEMSALDHSILLDAIAHIKGKFMLSGYRSELYDRYAKTFDWHRTDFDLPNNSAGGDKKRRMVECVWSNFKPSAP